MPTDDGDTDDDIEMLANRLARIIEEQEELYESIDTLTAAITPQDDNNDTPTDSDDTDEWGFY